MPARLAALALLVLWLALPAAAQTPLDLDRLDADIEAAVAAWPVPGLSIAIVQNGEVVFEKGYGVAEAGTDRPVDAHTLFAIASNTKAFTTAALAILVDEGRLDWDDPVRKHLPSFALYDPYVSEAMTVRDLVTHRSGLGTFSGDLLWYGTEYTPEEVVRRTRHVEPAGPFRASYGYSNLMFVAAGEVVRAVSGQPWSAFVEARLIRPLGMDRTVTSIHDLPAVANVATPHKPTPDEVRPIAWFDWDAMSSAGSIVSSASDMAEWIRLQLGGGALGDLRLFSEARQFEMWSPHTIVPISPASQLRNPATHFRAYGLGWFLNDAHGRKVIGHGGGYDGMFSRVALVPEEGLGVVILTNSMTGLQTALTTRILDEAFGVPPGDGLAEGLARDTTYRAEFFARIEAATTARPGGTSPTLALAGYAGTYGGPMYGDATVALDAGALVLRFAPAAGLVADLTPLHDDVFRLTWRDEYAWFGDGNVQFVLDAAGRPERLRFDVPNDDLWFYELEMARKE